MGKKFLKKYWFELDNFERGVNWRLKIIVCDINLKNAKRQTVKMFGKIISDKMILDFSQRI